MIALLMSCILGLSAGTPAIASPGAGLLTMAPPQEAPSAQTPATQNTRTVQNQYQLRQTMAGDLEEFRGGGLGLLLLIALAVAVVVVLIILL